LETRFTKKPATPIQATRFPDILCHQTTAQEKWQTSIIGFAIPAVQDIKIIRTDRFLIIVTDKPGLNKMIGFNKGILSYKKLVLTSV
jgi:hypothetical protein